MSNDLQIPAFLDRRKYDENGKLIRSPLPDFVLEMISGAPRTWAPIKSIEDCVRRQKPPIYCDDPKLEVQVVVKEGGNIRNLFRFIDWAEFLEEHDFNAYPLKRAVTVAGETIAQVGMTWQAPREPGSDKPRGIGGPRIAGTRDAIWKRADELWAAAGSPKDQAVVLKLRREWMPILEKEGIKKTTSSSELGNWQKARLR